MCMAAIIAAMTAVIESERSRLEDEEEEEERERKKREGTDFDDDDQHRYYIAYIHNIDYIRIYNDCYTYTSQIESNER